MQAPGVGGGQSNNAVKLTFLHTNDVHGFVAPVEDKVVLGQKASLGGAAYLATLVSEKKAENPGNTVLVDCGDAVHGALTTDFDQGRSMVDVMNRVGYDVATLGNHDFQWTVPVLEDRLRATRHPVVLANVQRTDGTLLPNTAPFVLKELGGLNVAFIGLVTEDTATQQRADRVRGARFQKPAEALKLELDQARKVGADLVVVVSHCGLPVDKELAEKFAGEGLIILGGHSHDRLEKPLFVGGNCIVQAGSLGKEVGQLDVEVDLASKRVVGTDYKLLVINPQEIPADPEIERLVKSYDQRARVAMGTVVSHLNASLGRSMTADAGVGNLVCDAMRAMAGAELAMTNAEGLRSDLPAGPITRGKLYEVTPYGGQLKVGTIKGKDVREALEHSLKRWPDDHNLQLGFLQVSGLKFSYDSSKPEGQQIVDVTVGDKPIEPEREYSIALEDYLATGRLGYDALARGNYHEVGNTVMEALEEYLVQHDGRVDAQPEGRIKDIAKQG